MAAKHTMSQERVRELFDYREGRLFWKIRKPKVKFGEEAGCLKGDSNYRVIRVDDVLYKTHRLIYLWHHGEMPPEIDHINRCRSDNRIENLRPLTHALNNANNGSRGTTKLPTGKWRAQITVHGENRHLGVFESEPDAHEAYLKAKGERIAQFTG